MAPESITPFDAPVTAQQDHHVRRLLTAFFHTEQQVPHLCGTVGNAAGNGLVGVIEHARSAGLYLADICAARHLKLEDSDAIRLVSSSPFDVGRDGFVPTTLEALTELPSTSLRLLLWRATTACDGSAMAGCARGWRSSLSEPLVL